MERVQSQKLTKHKNHPNPLSPLKEQMRDKRFVLEYMRNGNNATQAAIAVGCPAKSARVHGCNLLARPNILRLVKQKQKELEERIQLTVEDLLWELRNIATASMENYFAIDENGQPHLDLSQLTTEQWAAIEEITTETYWDGPKGDEREVKRTKFKLHSKGQAIDKAMRHFGAYNADRSGGGSEGQGNQATVYTLNIGNANIVIKKDGDQAAQPKLIEGSAHG